MSGIAEAEKSQSPLATMVPQHKVEPDSLILPPSAEQPSGPSELPDLPAQTSATESPGSGDQPSPTDASDTGSPAPDRILSEPPEPPEQRDTGLPAEAPDAVSAAPAGLQEVPDGPFEVLDVLESCESMCEVPERQLEAFVGAAGEACVPSGAGGEAACAEQLEVLGMLLASPCAGSSIVHAPEHLQLPLPRDGFMCDQCGDRFALPSSLELHQTRRALRATLQCPPCGKLLVFTNKCQLLEHLNLHKIDPVSIDPSLIDAFALTPAELGCKLPASAADSDPSAVNGNTINKVNRPVYVSCPMCNVLCSTLTLSEHLCPTPELEPDSGVSSALRCSECLQPCPTECSLMAHAGLHKRDLYPYPYVCPECGCKLLGTHAQAQRHAIVGCLHLLRDLKTCCAICGTEVDDAQAHVLQAHVQKLYKCRRCPLAFESTKGFDGHLADKHGGEVADGDACHMLILKCPFCAATFNNTNALRTHMTAGKHGDRQLQTQSFVFRCPECESDFAARGPLREHLAQAHPDFKLDTMSVPQRHPPTPPPPAQAPPPPPPSSSSSSPLTPPPPSLTARSPVTPVSPRGQVLGRPLKHTRQLRDVPVAPLPTFAYVQPSLGLGRGRSQSYTCIVCKQVFQRKTEYTEHARLHLREGIALCLLCNTRFGSEQTLKNHIADHASETGRDRCGLCYAKISQPQALQYHLEGEHNLRDFSCVRCELLFESLEDLSQHNSDHHGFGPRAAKSRRVEEPTQSKAARSPLETPVAKRARIDQEPADTGADTVLFQCFECDFSSDMRGALCRHVRETHSEDTNALEDVASLVADAGPDASQADNGDQEPDGEVIELEMNAGEITQKRSATAADVAPDAEYITPDLDVSGVPDRRD